MSKVTDSVQKLFQSFPTPEEGLNPQDGSYRQRIHDAIKKFLQAPRNSSRDPDCEQIRKLISAGMHLKFRQFATQLSQFALSKHGFVDRDSAKTRQLLYYRWMAQGRRDDEYPFSTAEDTNFESGERVKLRKLHALLPEDPTNTICAYCDRPGALIRCSGCQITINSHTIPGESYCGQECQRSDWPHHESVCLARRNLYRAVSIVYHLFIVIKEKTYSVKLASIREQHGILVAQERPWGEAACAGEMAIHPFPRSLASSKEQFRAALLSADCDAVMAVYKPLLDDFIKPLCAGLEEVSINPRNVHIPVCCPHDRGMNNSMFGTHMLLRATLHSGEHVAIDLSGGRFGWREPLAPWRQWIQHRAVGSIVSNSYGSVEKQMKLVEPFTGNVSKVTRRETHNLIRSIQRTVRASMLRYSVGGPDQLHRLSSTKFEALKEDTHSLAASALDVGLNELRVSKRCRLYFDRSWHLCATETSEQGEALSRVWFTDRTIESMKEGGADQEDYRRIWSLRHEGLPEIFRRLGHHMP